MGNSTSLLDDTRILDETKPVGFYIKNWALNNYQINPEMVKKSNDKAIFKNLLKKRACCTGQSTIGIDLPFINDIKKIGIKNVEVQIFEDTNLITDDICTMVFKEIPSPILKNFKYTSKREDSKRSSNSDACKMLYVGHTYSLSKQLQENRKQYLPSLYQSAYGPYSNKDNANPFKDLNCINSVYQLSYDNLKATDSTTPLSAQTLAQTNDPRCNNNGQIAWKYADESIEGPICVNTMNITGAVTSSDGAELKLNQGCTANVQNNSNVQNNTVTPAPEPTTPAVSTPAPNTAPAVSIPAPAVSIPAPAVSKPAPTVSKPAPAVSKPAPAVTIPAPAVSKPAPTVTIPAVSKPAPVTSTTSSILDYKIYIAAGGCLYCICIIFLIIIFLINKK
jgi:hypothetical protein